MWTILYILPVLLHTKSSLEAMLYIHVHFFGYSEASFSNSLYSIDSRPIQQYRHIVQRQMIKFLHSRISTTCTDLHKIRT